MLIRRYRVEDYGMLAPLGYSRWMRFTTSVSFGIMSSFLYL